MPGTTEVSSTTHSENTSVSAYSTAWHSIRSYWPIGRPRIIRERSLKGTDRPSCARSSDTVRSMRPCVAGGRASR
jgi:hypothetical protein